MALDGIQFSALVNMVTTFALHKIRDFFTCSSTTWFPKRTNLWSQAGTDLCNMTQCLLAYSYRCFAGTCWLNFQYTNIVECLPSLRWRQQVDYLRNYSACLPKHTASHPKRSQSL